MPPPRVAPTTGGPGRSVLGSTAVVAAGMVVGNGLLFVALIAVARTVAPREFAAVSAGIALLLWVTVPTIGVQSAAALTVAAGGGVGRLRRLSLLIGTAAATAVAALALTSYRALGFSSPAVLGWIAVLLIPQFLLTAARGVMQGRRRFSALGGSLLLEGVLRCVVVLVTLPYDPTAAGVMRAFVIATLPAAAHAWWVSRTVDGTGGSIGLRDLTRLPLAFALAYSAQTNLDAVIANARLDDASAGAYGVLVTIGKLTLFLPLAVTMVVLPEAATRRAAGAPMRPVLVRGIGLCLAGLLPIVAVGALFPTTIRGVVAGSRYPQVDAWVGWYLVAMACLGLSGVVAQIGLVRRDPRALAVAGLTVAGLLVAGGLIPARVPALVVTMMTVSVVALVGQLVVVARPVGDRHADHPPLPARPDLME